MNIMVIGYAQHGKDTVCEMLKDTYGLSFISSSLFVAEHVIYPKMANYYPTIEDCYKDRRNNRKLWYDLIADYNRDDLARLSREIFTRYDIYCGIRSYDELKAALHMIDLVIWVDASQRKPPESSASCSVNQHDAHLIIDNNKDKTHLQAQIDKLARHKRYGHLFKQRQQHANTRH